jgi:hypothetical protein
MLPRDEPICFAMDDQQWGVALKDFFIIVETVEHQIPSKTNQCLCYYTK